MNVEDPNHWAELLSRLLQPDSNIIKEATEILHGCLENPQSILSLFNQLQNSPDPSIRQLAGVLVRKKILVHWDSFPPEIKKTIQQGLMSIISEQDIPRPVRKAAVDISVRIAKKTIISCEWDEFLPLVIQMAQSPLPVHREMSLYVFQSLLEDDIVREEVLSQSIEGTFQMIKALLGDSSLEVQSRALGCANAFVELFSPVDETTNPTYLLDLITPVVTAIRNCLLNGIERVSFGFEFLEFQVEHFTKHVKSMLGDLLTFMLEVGAKEDLDISVRQQALLLVEYVISYKSKTFMQSNLLQKTIDVSFTLMTEPEEDDFEDDNTGYKYGTQLIDSLSLNIPPDYVFQPVMNKVTEYIKSSNPEARKAALMAVAMISQGCCDLVEENFDFIMGLVLTSFQDQEPVVRQASCLAIADFAKNLPVSLLDYAEQLVPILISGLSDQTDLVRIKSCYAISECTTSMSEFFMPHIEGLLHKMVELLSDRNNSVQELAVSAMTSLVEMAEERFEPYFNSVIVLMKRWMTVTDKKLIRVRARATECVGTLAHAVPKELFLPHVNEVIVFALDGLQLDDREMREFVFRFFEHFVHVFPEHTAQYVEKIMPILTTVATSSEGFLSFGAEISEHNLLGGEDMEDENLDLKAMGEFVEEKVAAISCIGEIAEHHSKLFSSHLSEATEVLIDLSSFELAPQVSAAALSALVQVCICVKNLLQPDFVMERGVVVPFTNELQTIIKTTVECITSNFSLPDDVMVRSSLEALGKLGLTFGPAVYEHCLSDVEEIIKQLLTRTAHCQEIRETFEEGDEDDFAMFATVMEMLTEMARSLGEKFVPSLGGILSLFERYIQNGSPMDYMNCCIATVAEILQELKQAFKPFCAAFVPFVIQLMERKTDAHVKHNACYCAGLLAQNGGETVFPFYPHLINAISPLFALNPKKNPTVADNACGTIARLIQTNPSLIPLEQVLPVLIGSLPLRNDFEPAIPVYTCIFDLLQSGNTVILSQIPQLIGLFAREIVHGDQNIGETVREQMMACLKQMVPSYGALIQEVFTALVNQNLISAADMEQLNRLLSS